MTSDDPEPVAAANADHIARDTARLYDGIVDWYVDAFFDDLSDSDWLDRWLKRVVPAGVVVDVGAGPGNFAKYIARTGMRVISTDISLEMVRASTRLTPEAAAAVSDMRRLPFADDVFDGVLCAYSIMHVPAPANRDVVREFARVLRRGGHLLLMIKTGLQRYSFGSSRVDEATSIMEPWERDDLFSELSGLGFTVVDTEVQAPSSPHEFDHPKLMVIARMDC